MSADVVESKRPTDEGWGLITARLRLRRLQPGDGAAMFAYRSEGHLVKSFWSGDRWADEVLCALMRSEWGR